MRSFLLGAAVLTLAACDSGTSTPTAVRYTVDGASTIRYTAADGSTQSATTTGAWQKDVSADDGALVVITAVSATGAPITASILVEDRLASSRHGSSVRVEARSRRDDDGDDDDDEAEVHGFVEALGTDRMTVSGRVFVVTSTTRLFDDNEVAVALATFIVGTYVEAEGVALGDGTFRATKIKIEDEDEGDGDDDDDDDGNETEVHGAIAAIDATSITVGTRVFTTTVGTRYLSDRNIAVSRASFTVGTRVEVEGYAGPAGTLIATKVKADDD